jgi:hypothetical protein
MRRMPAIATALLAAALALPAAPAAAKGLVGMSVCGAEGCVDRSALVPKGGGEDPHGLLDVGTSVADPGPGAFVRLKMHVGDPATGEAFGTSTLIYLTTSGLVRAEDGTWHMPGPEAATIYKRAAHHVARFPASALKPFRPPPVPEARVVETFSPASRPAPATAGDGGGSDFPAGLLGGAAAAIVLAVGGALVLTRRGRPATG